MPQRTLRQKRAEWFRQAFCLETQLPVLAVAVLFAAWVLPFLLPDGLPSEPQKSLVGWYIHLPYIVRVALLCPFAVFTALSLILAVQPFPRRADHALNEMISEARIAGRSAHAQTQD